MSKQLRQRLAALESAAITLTIPDSVHVYVCKGPEPTALERRAAKIAAKGREVIYVGIVAARVRMPPARSD
jgi:hypothetical protein